MNIYSVYEKYHKDFLTFAKSIVRDYNDAFDLVQDAYVSALEREEIFEYMNEYQIKGWFFTAIKNKNIDNFRKQNRLDYKWEVDMFTGANNFEEKIVVQDLLEKLPKKLKDVVVLRYEMNLNSTEIGNKLNLSPSTVRSQLSSALKILKDYL
ncbi:MAG: sigma-70 family RNA polymerase sigma factor [Tissierellaceae bacterium]|nr:sigma-70 family RNA polymerase sigma factor [Tissierellaceae bacterium]